MQQIAETAESVLVVEDLQKSLGAKTAILKIIDGISFTARTTKGTPFSSLD